MALFRTDSVSLCYSNIEAAKQWWIDAFGCKASRVPKDWDISLSSDVALTFPGDDVPTILLSVQAEAEQAGLERSSPMVSVIFSDKLKKAHEHLSRHGVPAGPIQDRGDMQFFEVRDGEGHLIQICEDR
jgi:hypothetical protein